MNPQNNDSSEQKKRPFSQLAVAALGCVLVLSVLGFLGYSAMFGSESPPRITVVQDSVEDQGNSFLVRFRARNAGGQAAAAVIARAILLRDGHQVDQAEATLQYIPSHSESRGGFYFSQDPRQGELRLSVSGYQKP